MAFSDTTLDGGHWCSRADCRDVLDNLERILDANEMRLNRCIAAATGEVQSWLRGRWPESWPFSSPPQELREAVATIAVYRATRGTAFSGGSLEISDRLLDDARQAIDWVKAIGDGNAHLSFTGTSHVRHTAVVAQPPGGEFGFGR